MVCRRNPSPRARHDVDLESDDIDVGVPSAAGSTATSAKRPAGSTADTTASARSAGSAAAAEVVPPWHRKSSWWSSGWNKGSWQSGSWQQEPPENTGQAAEQGGWKGTFLDDPHLCSQVVVKLRPAELNKALSTAQRLRFGYGPDDDVVMEFRKLAAKYNVSVSVRNRGGKQYVTVKAMSQPKDKEERLAAMADIRVVLEKVLVVYAAGGEDMAKLTLPAYAKHRGRLDEDALFRQVAPTRTHDMVRNDDGFVERVPVRPLGVKLKSRVAAGSPAAGGEKGDLAAGSSAAGGTKRRLASPPRPRLRSPVTSPRTAGSAAAAAPPRPRLRSPVKTSPRTTGSAAATASTDRYAGSAAAGSAADVGLRRVVITEPHKRLGCKITSSRRTDGVMIRTVRVDKDTRALSSMSIANRPLLELQDEHFARFPPHIQLVTGPTDSTECVVENNQACLVFDVSALEKDMLDDGTQSLDVWGLLEPPQPSEASANHSSPSISPPCTPTPSPLDFL